MGRDLLSRLLLGARTTLGVALLAAVGAVLIGVLIGGGGPDTQAASSTRP